MNDCHWFKRFNQNEAPYRLICFPSVGAGPGFFRHWANALQHVEIWAAALPGRARRIREPAKESMAELLDAMLPHFARLTDKPYLLLGHSMGALIAREVAQRVRDQRLPPPAHLFVSAFRSPDQPNRNRQMHGLADADFLQELRRYGGTPDQILDHPQMMQALLPALRADFKLHETWRYSPSRPLACPMTALAGLNDPVVTVGEMEGWYRHTSCDFELMVFAGAHFFIEEAFERVMRLLQRRIDGYYEREIMVPQDYSFGQLAFA